KLFGVYCEYFYNQFKAPHEQLFKFIDRYIDQEGHHLYSHALLQKADYLWDTKPKESYDLFVKFFEKHPVKVLSKRQIKKLIAAEEKYGAIDAELRKEAEVAAEASLTGFSGIASHFPYEPSLSDTSRIGGDSNFPVADFSASVMPSGGSVTPGAATSVYAQVTASVRASAPPPPRPKTSPVRDRDPKYLIKLRKAFEAKDCASYGAVLKSNTHHMSNTINNKDKKAAISQKERCEFMLIRAFVHCKSKADPVQASEEKVCKTALREVALYEEEMNLDDLLRHIGHSNPLDNQLMQRLYALSKNKSYVSPVEGKKRRSKSVVNPTAQKKRSREMSVEPGVAGAAPDGVSAMVDDHVPAAPLEASITVVVDDGKNDDSDSKLSESLPTPLSEVEEGEIIPFQFRLII
ncbi:MAG: hypothetical protein NTV32_06510, partial [Gammaproteobacteria bacterium]|nr:hypothetical protein [Gammaproteobacteria bacterium]